LRFKYQGIFKEIHIKVFNTGKMEIPGVQNPEFLEIAKIMILKYLKQYINSEIHFVNPEEENNVLINSNFKCGFYINQNKLYSILNGSKYNIETSYDPCTYPGVKCKFYYNNEIADDDAKQNGQILQQDRCMKMSELIENKKYTEISFMIFRTGSCLILGHCNEHILNYVYKFIKNILIVEYAEINALIENVSDKIKKPKIRKRTIKMTKEYYSSIFRENI
jgi:TATA-box binding protein (TBP) (component of TFIID and TFIIIB)